MASPKAKLSPLEQLKKAAKDTKASNLKKLKRATEDAKRKKKIDSAGGRTERGYLKMKGKMTKMKRNKDNE